MTVPHALDAVRVLLEQIEQRVAAYVPRAGTELLLPEVLMGPLALRFSRAAASYQNRETQFVEDVWGIFEQLGLTSKTDAYFDGRFEHAPAYTFGSPDGRRLPKPFETVVETMRRLRDANAIRRQVEPISSAIIGGSASYGRFYNVRGSGRPRTVPVTGDRPAGKLADSSDLDLLIVVSERNDVTTFIERLAQVNFVDQDGIDLARARAKTYLSLDFEGPSLFSQKFRVWGSGHDPVLDDIDAEQDYKVSVHIANQTTFDRLVLKGQPIDDDRREIVEDYRVDEPSSGIARGFDGYHEEFDHKYHAVADGFVVRQRIYDTFGGRYKPGLHQQLILPQFDVRWSNATVVDVELPIIEFKWKVVDRLRVERNKHPLRQQTLSLAHVRHHVFSPHVRRRTDDYEREY